jgi:hypothetical protein
VPTDKESRDGPVTVTLQRRGEERTGEKIRGQQIRGDDAPQPVIRHNGNGYGSADWVHPSRIEIDSLLPDPLSASRVRARTRSKTDDFEEVLDRMEKAIVEGNLDPVDYEALARVTGHSPKQARVAVRQLRDRKRLPR